MLTLQSYAEQISDGLGIRLRGEDLPAVCDHLAARIRSCACHGMEDYLRVIFSDDDLGKQEREHFIVRFTTGESYFLRDARQFDVVVKQLVPELLERRAETRRLRIWSAGCSSGEEPYTLAMLLREQVPDLAGWAIEIVASDINTRVLDRARAGRYAEWSFRALDNERRNRYFRRSGHEWVIDETLRKPIRFEQIDLVTGRIPDESAGLADFDLILCRNVLIYMTPLAIGRVVRKFDSALAEGGYLVTGHGELLGHNTRGLRSRIFADAVVLLKDSGAADREADMPPFLAKAPVPEKMRSVPLRPALFMPRAVAAPSPARLSVEQLMQQAWRQADRGEARDANQSCDDAIKLAPFDPWPYYLKAQLAQESGDISLAKDMLGKSIYLDPAMVAAYLELAVLLEEGGAMARANSLLRAACRELRRLPETALIKPYAYSTAADLLTYIEKRLNQSILTGREPVVRAPLAA